MEVRHAPPARHGGLVAASAAVLSCDRGTTPTDPADSATPAFNFLNGPAAAGPLIVRFEAQLAFINLDQPAGLVSIHGLGVDDPADSFFCGGPLLEIMSFQEIFGPSGALHELVQSRENTHHIYDLDAFNAAFDRGGFCPAIQIPRLAEGVDNLTSDDNDVLVSGTRSNSFGWSAEGTLDDLVNGGQVRVTDVLRGVIQPDGDFRFTVLKIELSPIGQ